MRLLSLFVVVASLAIAAHGLPASSVDAVVPEEFEAIPEAAPGLFTEGSFELLDTSDLDTSSVSEDAAPGHDQDKIIAHLFNNKGAKCSMRGVMAHCNSPLIKIACPVSCKVKGKKPAYYKRDHNRLLKMWKRVQCPKVKQMHFCGKDIMIDYMCPMTCATKKILSTKGGLLKGKEKIKHPKAALKKKLFTEGSFELLDTSDLDTSSVAVEGSVFKLAKDGTDQDAVIGHLFRNKRAKCALRGVRGHCGSPLISFACPVSCKAKKPASFYTGDHDHLLKSWKHITCPTLAHKYHFCGKDIMLDYMCQKSCTAKKVIKKVLSTKGGLLKGKEKIKHAKKAVPKKK